MRFTQVISLIIYYEFPMPDSDCLIINRHVSLDEALVGCAGSAKIFYSALHFIVFCNCFRANILNQLNYKIVAKIVLENKTKKSAV